MTKKTLSARERTLRKLQRLSQMALVVALPVVNTACDYAPEPVCESGPVDADEVTILASWFRNDAGEVRISLTWSVDQGLVGQNDYTATFTEGSGATSFEYETAETTSILPLPEVTEIRVNLEMWCGAEQGFFVIVLDTSEPPAIGADVPVTVIDG